MGNYKKLCTTETELKANKEVRENSTKKNRFACVCHTMK